MSHPIPSHDYSEKGSDESKKDYSMRKRKGTAKSKALDKVKRTFSNPNNCAFCGLPMKGDSSTKCRCD